MKLGLLKMGERRKSFGIIHRNYENKKMSEEIKEVRKKKIEK